MEKMLELEGTLKEKEQANETLAEEISQMKQQLEDKDKKIRELTIRLETRNKFGVKESELTIGGDTKLENSFANSDDMFLFGGP